MFHTRGSLWRVPNSPRSLSEQERVHKTVYTRRLSSALRRQRRSHTSQERSASCRVGPVAVAPHAADAADARVVLYGKCSGR